MALLVILYIALSNPSTLKSVRMNILPSSALMVVARVCWWTSLQVLTFCCR